MASVFNNTQNFGGSFSSKYSTVAFQGFAAGHLTQQVQFQYQQQVTMLYELGSNNVYYVGGRAQGTATLSKLVGPAGVSVAALYADICKPGDIKISQQSGCYDAGTRAYLGYNGGASRINSKVTGTTYLLQNAVLTAMAGTQTAQDVVFTETLSFMYLNLDVSDVITVASVAT